MNTMIETKEILYSMHNDIAVISLKAGAFSILTSLEVKKQLLDLLLEIDQNDSIKGLILINTAQYPGDVQNRKVFQEIMQGGSEGSHERSINGARMRYAMEQLAILTVKFTKPMIAGMQGDITGEFFGNLLPFDFRFATEDTVLKFPNVQLGFPPSDVLAYYLNRYLSPGKATEILMLGQDISAQQAEEIGLLTVVNRKENLLNRCLETMAEVCKLPLPVLSATRSLLHPEVADLEAYLDRAFSTTWKPLYLMNKVDFNI